MNNNRNRYTISVPENNGVTVYSTNACPDDDKIAVPTTSSGVPGPTEMLYYEPNVPLYMFGYQTTMIMLYCQKQVIRVT